MARPLITAEQFHAELRRYGLVPTGIKRTHIEVWRRSGTNVDGTVPVLIGFVPQELLVEVLRQFGLNYILPDNVN